MSHNKRKGIFLVILTIFILLDQFIKQYIIDLAGVKNLSPLEMLDSFTTIFYGEIISISLVFNKGVAFSFLSWAGEYLKYIQSFFIFIILTALLFKKEILREYFLVLCFVISGGISNILDRFIHGGVVDYIYYHYGFNFPIFNLADIFINIGLVIFISHSLFFRKK